MTIAQNTSPSLTLQDAMPEIAFFISPHGLVQRDALHEDIPATIARLAAFLPFAESLQEPSKQRA